MMYVASLFIVYSITASIVIVLPLLALFGFFENRNNGNYIFRTRRFLITVLCLLVINIAGGFYSISSISSMIIGASQVAETAVLKNRARIAFQMDIMELMFPRILTENLKQCYRAAASNYVENQWDQSFRNEDCSTNAPHCINTYKTQKWQDYFDVIRERVNPRHLEAFDFSTIGYFIGSMWVTASDVYITLRRLYGTLDSNGHKYEPPSEKMLADYKKNFSDCASLKPLSWITPGEDLTMSKPGLCIGKCP